MLMVDIKLSNGILSHYRGISAVSVCGNTLEMLDCNGNWIYHDLDNIQWFNVV